jgi:hypothetical protein
MPSSLANRRQLGPTMRPRNQANGGASGLRKTSPR